MADYFSHTDLLETPNNRAAYSDRTSYLMAEMSRLAYFRFEGGSNLDEILEQARKLVTDTAKWHALEALIKSRVPANDPAQSRQILSDILNLRDFTLVETFNSPATDAQGFLCVRKDPELAILVFRGTEAKLKDIKTDVKAQLKEVEANGRKALMHEGYFNQFESLKDAILAALARPAVKGKQIFITGHSLGGALAITATKFLADDTTGACYTFGSPPVGTEAFDYDIRPPIYRVVNHIDIVPRLPSPVLVYIFRGLAFLVSLALTPFAALSAGVRASKWYKSVSKTLLDAQKYRQSGYGSYLVGDGRSVRLRYAVTAVDKLGWWSKQIPNMFSGEFKLLSDHSIETYSEKLAAWAEVRRKP